LHSSVRAIGARREPDRCRQITLVIITVTAPPLDAPAIRGDREQLRPPADEDRSQVSVVQIHPDAASMEFHLDVVGDRARQAYAQTLEASTGIQVFGTPTERILRMLRQQAGSGVPLSINPRSS